MNQSAVLFAIGSILGVVLVAFFELRGEFGAPQTAGAAETTEPAAKQQASKKPSTRRPASRPSRRSSQKRTAKAAQTRNRDRAQSTAVRESTGGKPSRDRPEPTSPVSGKPARGAGGGRNAAPEQDKQRSSSVSATPGKTPTPANSARSGVTPKPRRTKPPEPPAERKFTIQISRILVGADVAAKGLVSEAVFEKQADRDRYIVYFELIVGHGGGRGSPRIQHTDFRLEDQKGLLYEPLKASHALDAVLQPGATARGGVAFAVYNDGAPARLFIRTSGENFTPLPESIFSRRPE